MRQKVNKAEDARQRFRRCCIGAVVGNSIDPGVSSYEFSFEGLREELLNARLAVDDSDSFLSLREPGKRILYLLDNAGEAVLDTLLADEIRRGGEVVGVVKSGVYQNDVTIRDVKAAGLIDHFDDIVESGSDGSSIFMRGASETLLRKLIEADLLISKGMSNYEYLLDESEVVKPVFYLLKAKCDVVAESLGVALGSYVAKLDMRSQARRPSPR